jgi:hypothetical protein
MTQQPPDLRAETDAMLNAAGIVVTPDGLATARARLAAAAARHTPEVRAALREQVGRPAAAAA